MHNERARLPTSGERSTLPKHYGVAEKRRQRYSARLSRCAQSVARCILFAPRGAVVAPGVRKAASTPQASDNQATWIHYRPFLHNTVTRVVASTHFTVLCSRRGGVTVYNLAVVCDQTLQ
jgi:hypothetical protein